MTIDAIWSLSEYQHMSRRCTCHGNYRWDRDARRWASQQIQIITELEERIAELKEQIAELKEQITEAVHRRINEGILDFDGRLMGLHDKVRGLGLVRGQLAGRRTRRMKSLLDHFDLRCTCGAVERAYGAYGVLGAATFSRYNRIAHLDDVGLRRAAWLASSPVRLRPEENAAAIARWRQRQATRERHRREHMHAGLRAHL